MNGLKTNPVISRHEHLAVLIGLVLAKESFGDDNELLPGTVLGKLANGKYRPYAEAATTAATDDASPTVSLDQTDVNFKHFKVGDVIEGVGDEALGTIQAINSATGDITLTGNATSNAYEGPVRVRDQDLSCSKADVRILGDYAELDERIDLDVQSKGYAEGFFHKDKTSLTATLITDLSIRDLGDNEVRLV